jgi:hypothetical protein
MAMGSARVRVTGVALAAALVIGGCGGGSSGSSGSSGSRGSSGSSGSKASGSTAGATPAAPAAPKAPARPRRSITIPTPKPTGIAAAPGEVRVIRGWADALRRGDVRRAARYFALPSTMINGVAANGQVSVIRIRTPLQAEYANATLPCGARFLKADQRGRYVNALFRLTGRPGPGGATCQSGAGQTARTNFVIRHGRIVAWIRAPDDPGDNGRPHHPPLVPPTPGPVV